MANVIVLEFPEEADGFPGAIEAVRAALPDLPAGTRMHVAIKEDAQRVLKVFQSAGGQG
jgi:hypothetical protein